jgi:hypothetical protein
MSIQQFPGGYVKDGVAYHIDRDAVLFRALEFSIAAQEREEQRQRDALEARRVYTERVANFMAGLTKDEFRIAELAVMEHRLTVKTAKMRNRT